MKTFDKVNYIPTSSSDVPRNAKIVITHDVSNKKIYHEQYYFQENH